jgi:hypothetical protein
MVGVHQLYTSLALNGEIYVFGGSLRTHQSNKIKVGASVSHILSSGCMFWIGYLTIEKEKICGG